MLAKLVSASWQNLTNGTWLCHALVSSQYRSVVESTRDGSTQVCLRLTGRPSSPVLAAVTRQATELPAPPSAVVVVRSAEPQTEDRFEAPMLLSATSLTTRTYVGETRTALATSIYVEVEVGVAGKALRR